MSLNIAVCIKIVRINIHAQKRTHFLEGHGYSLPYS